jgi:hypothetical protein
VATWTNDAARLALVAEESEGRDVEDDASDTPAAAAADDVETVDEEDDTAVARLVLLLALPSPSPSPVPVAMQRRGRSFIWTVTGYHSVPDSLWAGCAWHTARDVE